MPSEQSTQADKPVDTAILPAAQSVHTDRPVVAAYLPFAHATHAEADEPPVLPAKVPTGQAVHTVALMVEYVPVGHVVADVCVVVVQKEPVWKAQGQKGSAGEMHEEWAASHNKSNTLCHHCP